jgi:hypothetical protein
VAYLTISAFDVPVNREASRMTVGDIGGASVRAFAGNLRSTRRWVKRQWEMTTIPMLFSDIAALVAIIGSPQGGNFVSCTGTFNNNVAVTCEVSITGREDVKVSNTVIRQRLTLAVKEV